MPTGTPIAKHIKAAAVSLMEQGFATKDVAKAMGLEFETVRCWRKRMGVLAERRKPKAEMASTGKPDCAGAAQKAGAVEVGLPAPPAPADPMVASLMARGLSRQAAVQSAALYRSRRVHGRHHARPAP